MKKNYDFGKKWSGPLILSLISLLIFCGMVYYKIMDYNDRENSISENGDSSNITVAMDTNIAKGERWSSEFQTVDSPETPMLFSGETVNCSISNDNSYDIRKWYLKISPKNECYLNGFWGGSIEIHQFRNGNEIVETVNEIVNSSEIKKLEVNPYLDTMMIRILPGDYFTFSPFSDSDSDIIKAKDKTGIAFNFYYIDPLDFSDNDFFYRSDIKLEELWVYPLLIVLWILWLGFMIFYFTVVILNKRFQRDFENSVKSISVMADLYIETYIIDLSKQSAKLIKGNKQEALFQFEKEHIQESLYKYAEADCHENYAENLKKFFDLTTLAERMSNVSSIVFEYRSNKIGYCSLRIFKLDSTKDLTQFVLAVQDINEERQKLHDIEEHVQQAKDTFMIQGSFIDNAFYSMNELVADIRETSKALSLSIQDDEHRMMALSINHRIEHLHLLKNCVYDLFSLEKGEFYLKSEVYNIYDVTEKIDDMMKPFYLGKEYEFQTDIDPKLPKKLKGDKERIMQIITCLLCSSMFVTQKGFVKFSVFGKRDDNKEELIFSVKDSAIGFTSEQVIEIREILRESDLKPLENAALVYLQIMNQVLRQMNSELKIVSVYGTGSEFYFSLEQEIIEEKVSV